MHLDKSSSAGMFPISFVGVPGIHGAAVIGVQGIGVSTPKAAEVAEATAGLARERHIANPGMFTKGLLSMMLAAGMLAAKTLFTGRTINEPGAAPNEHIIIAPFTT